MITGIHLGTVVGSQIEVNRDSENEVRMLSCELTEADDVQSIELISQNGEQTNPQDDTGVVILDFGRAWKIAIAVRDNVEPDSGLARGEKIIYSVDANNTIKAKIYLRSDGSVYVGDGDQYVALANKVDAFISDVVDLLTGWSVLAQDGGAALQNAANTLWATPPSTTASSNLKADE